MTLSVRIDPASNSALYILGDELVLDVRWVDKDGAILPIDETATFLATISRAGHGTVASVSHEPVGAPAEPTARFSFPLSIAGDLAGQRGVYVTIQQVLAPGSPPTVASLFTFNLPVRQLGDALAPIGGPSPNVSAPTLIEVRPSGVVISPRGPSGASAAQQLASARNPDSGEPYIAEPTVSAMADWLVGVAAAGNEDAIATAAEALTAAQAAAVAAQQAGSASVRGIDLPWRDADQTVEVRGLLAAGYNVVRFQSGKKYRFSNVGALPVLNPVDRDSFALAGNDTTVQHVWDPANPSTLLAFYYAQGGRDQSLTGITYEPSPRVDTQGTVRQIVTGSGTVDVIFAVAPMFEPAFTSADNVLRIETYPDGAWGCSAGKYKTAGKSRPFPLVPHVVNGSQVYDAPTGWKLFKASPTDVGVKPTGIISYTPQLIFSMAAGDLSGNEELTGSLFSDTLGLLLNGKTFVTELLEDADPENATLFTIRDAVTGAYVNAAAAVDIAIGAGAFTIPAAPTWLTAGIELLVHCRKRGSNPFFMRGVKGLTRIQMRFKGSLSVPLFLWDFDTLYLDVLGRGDTGAYSASNGGPVNCFNGRYVYGPGIVWFGSGDDVCNIRTRSWQSRVRAWNMQTLLWLDVEFNAGNAFGNNPTKPALGDKIEFALNLDPRNEQVRTVKTVGTSPTNPLWTRMTFVEGALPNGFDPMTCRILNRSTVATIDLDKLSSMASWGRVLVCQSHDCRIRELTAIGTRLPPVLALSSNGRRGGSLGDGGFKGGLGIDRFVARHSAIDTSVSDTSDLRALIRIEAKTLDQKPLGGATGWRRCIIGTFDAEDYPFTSVYVEGVDLDIVGRSVRQGGMLRPSSLFAGYGNYDYLAKDATISLGGRNAPGYDETFLELDRGFVTFVGGSGLRSAGTLDPNAVAITAAKNVADPASVEIRIGGGPPLQPASYSANGTRTLTLIAPAVTSGAAIAYAVTHTRS